MKQSLPDGVLLDTHTWIWLSEGSSELKPNLINLIDNVAQLSGVFIAAISVWEIAMLAAKRRIIFQTPVDTWINQALSQPNVDLVPLLPSIAIESAQLPGDFHGDPADCMIVATARVKNLTLITRDQNINQYAEKGFLKTIAF